MGGKPVRMSRPGDGPIGARRRYAAGRRIKVPRSVKTVRDLMRRHLREGGVDMKDLAKPFDVHVSTVKRMFWERSRPLAPQHIDAFVEFMKLDEFDAQELRWYGAREAGWQLDKDLLDTVLGDA